MALALSTGLVAPHPVHAGGGGGYTTGAVSFDGATYLTNSALASTDNSFLSGSFWFYQAASENAPVLWSFNPAGGSVTQGLGLDHNNSPADSLFFQFSNGNDTVSISFGSATLSYGGWHNVVFSANLSGTPSGKIFVDGIDSTGSPNISGSGGTFVINGLPALFGNDTFGDYFTGYMADAWIAPGVSLLSGGTIPAGTIAKFISGGKPVSLGATGSTPTGTAPAIFLRRATGAAASTFATNLGTGGNFTITGTLTNAPSSPSG